MESGKLSTLTRLYCAATKEDVESLLGFDEGPINDASYVSLQKQHNVQVVRQFQREKSVSIIRAFGVRAGLIIAS